MLILLLSLASWEILTVPTNEDLLGVSFIDDQKGWVVGKNDEIIYTTDGGDSWNSQSSPTNFVDLYDVIFVDQYNGWACGWNASTGFGTIIGTTDGGYDWNTQSSNISGYTEGIYFTDQNYGWAVGIDPYSQPNSQTMRTTNGGSTWYDYTLTYVSYLKDVYFINTSTGFACGSNGLVIKSTNGGINWTFLTTGITKKLYDIQAFDENNIIVAGDTFLLTTNGGSNWIFRDISKLKSLSFSEMGKGWVCGDSGIFYTEDSGQTWNQETTNVSLNLNSIDMVDTQVGFCVGDNGTVLRRKDPSSVAEYKIAIDEKINLSSGIYDITGRKVSRIRKGIYFIVGRKGVTKVVRLE